MIVETERLKIVECTEESAQFAFDQHYDNGPYVMNYLEALKRDTSLAGWGSWLIIRKLDERVIGDMGFKGKPSQNKVVEIGYGLLEAYWNKGYATEAANALINWAFATNRVNRVMAEVLKENLASIHVLEKIGMKRLTEVNEMYYYQIKRS